MRHEVRFSGFGGQGIILSAVILGRAAVMYDNKFAVQTQVYGPEARGGAVAARRAPRVCSPWRSRWR